MKKNIFSICLIVLVILFFFSPVIYKKYPIPADTIIGLYHPFRDLYSIDYPRGVTFKNFLITDPIRQQYPWRKLAVEKLKNLELPLWNPYNFSGTPLLANMQSAVFYPLNIIFLLLPFNYAWSINVFLQSVLSGIFLFIYLRNLRLNAYASVLSSIAFTFSGFNVAWLEWNMIVHTGLWLPLILLSIDKIFHEFQTADKYIYTSRLLNFKITAKKYYLWSVILIFALASSFFAGHLQTFFYLYLTQLAYFLWRLTQHANKVRLFSLYILLNVVYLFCTLIQWMPTMQFIQLSARSVDMVWSRSGWFLPWQNLIQLIIPDFFGNPSTLNYWGVWNYAEFSSYVGILPLIMSIYAIFFRYDKKILFFGFIFFLSLIFSLPTLFAKIPYILNLPLISSSQPTRLLFLTDFSLAVLAGLGLDMYMKSKNKIIYALIFVLFFFVLAVFFIIYAGSNIFQINSEFINVTKRNTYLPLILFTAVSLLLLFGKYLNDKLFKLLIICLIFVTVLDLLRFANKFTPFSPSEYLFPQTKTLEYLKKNAAYNRTMSIDSRILPPNFSIIYKIYTVDGYDPLYLRTYGELIAASERGKPDIKPPFGFNRIINPQNYDSRIIDLMGVKYILSLLDISLSSSRHYIKVFQEGETRVYQNTKALPRVFFVEDVITVSSKQEVVNKMFDEKINLALTAIVEHDNLHGLSIPSTGWSVGRAEIISYNENNVIIHTISNGDGFLVFTDSYYPSWQAVLDGKIKLNIYKTDYNFRGVIVPKGNHTIKFFIK